MNQQDEQQPNITTTLPLPSQSLINAAAQGKVEKVKHLISQGVSCLGKLPWVTAEPTPLHAVSICGNVEIINCLLLAGCDPNIRNYHNITPLSKLVYMGHKDAILLLLDAGADVDSNLKESIEKIVGKDKIQFIETLKDNDLTIYRKSDINGNPVKTYQERNNELKLAIGIQEGSYLLGFSLFKTKPGIPEAITSGNIGQYLTVKDGTSALCVSKVEEGSIENNSIKYLEKIVSRKL